MFAFMLGKSTIARQMFKYFAVQSISCASVKN